MWHIKCIWEVCLTINIHTEDFFSTFTKDLQTKQKHSMGTAMTLFHKHKLAMNSSLPTGSLRLNGITLNTRRGSHSKSWQVKRIERNLDWHTRLSTPQKYGYFLFSVSKVSLNLKLTNWIFQLAISLHLVKFYNSFLLKIITNSLTLKTKIRACVILSLLYCRKKQCSEWQWVEKNQITPANRQIVHSLPLLLHCHSRKQPNYICVALNFGYCSYHQLLTVPFHPLHSAQLLPFTNINAGKEWHYNRDRTEKLIILAHWWNLEQKAGQHKSRL